MRHAVLLGIAYFVAAFLTVAFTRFGGGVAMLWIATGILAADFRHRPRYSWALRSAICGFASLVVTSTVGLGPVAALPMAIVNIGEAVLIAKLLDVFQPERGQVSTPREIGMLVLFAAIIVPIISAFPGAAIAHLSAGVAFWSNWAGWFTAHALGALTIMPLAKLILGGNVRDWIGEATKADWFEAGLLISLMLGVNCLVFLQSRLPLLFLPFLPLMIAVFRLGRIGAALGLVLLAAIGGGSTLNGLGPINLIGGGIGQHVQFLQFYLATAFLMSLLPAAELYQRKRLYTQLAESAALHHVIADRSGDIVMVLDVEGAIRFVSPSVERLSGLDPEALVGRAALEIILPEDADGLIAMHRQAMANPDETFMHEFRAIQPDLLPGGIGWFETHTRATIDRTGTATGAVSVIREVSERKARELELAQAATTDPLTGLLNRRGFDVAYNECKSSPTGQTQACIAMFDIDHFKGVNDRYGHGAGDEVLKSFSAVLMNAVRDTDVLSRLGGEEFAVLLPNTDLDEARTVCERIRMRFGDTVMFTRDQARLSVTVSAGLTRVPQNATLAQTLRLVDEALYAAKASGRNCLSIAA